MKNTEESVMSILLDYDNTKKERAIEYCEKKLAPLEEADKNKGTDYVHTLEVYLESGNDLLHSAEKMFIHRNTMINRMRKISTLLGVDVNSPKERAELNNVYFVLNHYNIKL